MIVVLKIHNAMRFSYSKAAKTDERPCTTTVYIRDYSEIDFDEADDAYLKYQAELGAQSAVFLQQQHTKEFDTAAAKRRAEAGSIDQEQCKRI
jgi:3'-phosphoadenosine 5'-phosphosulfate (PAPS) 3'-phosphatase